MRNQEVSFKDLDEFGFDVNMDFVEMIITKWPNGFDFLVNQESLQRLCTYLPTKNIILQFNYVAMATGE